VGGSNNSLGSIASISKKRGRWEKKEQETGKKTKGKGASDMWKRTLESGRMK